MASNYEQLIKALRCCISKNPPETCVGCTYSKCNNECAVRRMILDAAAAIEELQAEQKKTVTQIFGEEQIAWEGLCKDLMYQIADLQAQLSKRGEWIYKPKDAIEMMFTLPKCSVCGHESSDANNFCPNCGAKMEETEDEVHSDI